MSETETQPAPPRIASPSIRPALLPPEEPTIPLTGIALVLAVAGLLLFMAVPKRSLDAAALEAQRVELELRQALGELREAIDDYHRDHGRWPAAEAGGTRPSALNPSEGFVSQLEVSGDADAGAPDRPSPSYRGYLTHGIPANPLNGSARVRVLAAQDVFPTDPDGPFGWIYSPLTGELRANSPGFLGSSRIRIFDL